MPFEALEVTVAFLPSSEAFRYSICPATVVVLYNYSSINSRQTDRILGLLERVSIGYGTHADQTMPLDR